MLLIYPPKVSYNIVMLINIETIPVAYINLSRDTAKNAAMQTMLADFSNVNRIEAVLDKNNAVLGLAKSQKIAVDSITVPGIVLEDDCVKASFRSELDVPDDADIVFLGIWEQTKPAIPAGKYLPAYTSVNDDWVRVFSMNGSHAIMFVSETGKKIASQAYEIASRTELWNDAILNRALPFIKAYAPKYPVFKQTSQLEATDINYASDFVITDPGYLDNLISTPADIVNL